MDIKLMISYATRNSIYALLNDFVSILSGQETTEEDRKKLHDQSNDLLAELRKLKRFKYRDEDGEPKRKTFRKSALPTSPEYLEIGYELKQEIVNLLMQNLDCSIDFLDDLSEEDKQKLIAENEKLSEKLKKLDYVSTRDIVAISKDQRPETPRTSSHPQGQTPVRTLANTTDQTPVKISSQISSQTPSHTSLHTPVHTHSQTPSHAPNKIPDQTLGKSPSQPLAHTPNRIQSQTQVESPSQTLVQPPSETPTNSTGQTAVKTSSQTPDLDAFDRKLKKELDERVLLLDELLKQEQDKSIAEMDVKLNELKLSHNQQTKELNGLKASLNQLTEKLTKELNGLKASHNQQTEKLTEELNGLKASQKKLDVNSSEKVFNFNLQNVRAFFNDTTKRFSEFFFCLSFKWSILAYHVKKRGKVSDRAKYLQLHLFREDGLDEDKHEGQSINWECNTSFEIRVLSQSDKVEDRVESFDYTFVQPSEYASFGETEFMNYSDLQNGYIKQDGSIDIRVFLKVNSFRRY